MKLEKSILLITILISGLIASCSDTSLTEKIPRLEEYETVDGKPVFKAPEVPDWVNERKFDRIEVVDENGAEILKTGIEFFKKKDFVSAYSYLVAAGENNQKVAYLYLGLIMGQPGELAYPRGAIASYYEALDSGAHASALLSIARDLAAGTNIENDDAGAAQYYARLEMVFKDKNHVLVKEANAFQRKISKNDLKIAEERERSYLLSNGQPAKGNLKQLIKLSTKTSGSSKAPGTEYLKLN